MRVLRRLYRILVWAVCGTVLLAVVLVGAAFVALSLQDHGPWDLGPHRGTAVAAPQSAPTSSLQVGVFVVECYGQAGKPVVIVSRRRDGSVVGAWRVGQVVNGKVVATQLGPADLVRAKKKKTGWVVHGGISGEHATYYFDDAGKLVEYYISWS